MTSEKVYVGLKATSDGPAGIPWNFVSGGIITSSDQKSGQENPAWRRMVAEKKNATTPYSRTSSFVDVRPGNFSSKVGRVTSYLPYRTSPSHSCTWSGWFGNANNVNPILPKIPFASHDSAVLSVALARFNEDIQSKLSPFKGGVFAGEIRETVRMVKRRGFDLLGLIKDYHKSARKIKRFFRKDQLDKRLADLWLEGSFGWRPLFHDIEDLSTALCKGYEKVLDVRGAHGSTTVNQTETAVTLGPIYEVAATKVIRTTKKSGALIVGQLVFDVPPSENSLKGTAEAFGFTAAEFVPTLWELIPYSFLVDYFSNVGSVISSVFTDRSNLAWSSQSQKTFETRRHVITNARWNPGISPAYLNWGFSLSTPVVTCAQRRFNRSIPSSYVPGVHFTYPALDSTKWVNIAALVLAKCKT